MDHTNVLTEESKQLLEKLNKFCRPLFKRWNKQPKREIRTAIMTWWNNGNPEAQLDLSHCDPKTVQQIPLNVIEAISAKSVSLVMPASLRQIDLPKWLPKLNSISRLEFPNYQDPSIDLKKIFPENPYELVISGRNIKKIEVSEQAEAVYTTDVLESIKPTVKLYDKSLNHIGDESPVDHAYYSSSMNRRIYFDNFNHSPKARLISGREMECAIMAISEVNRRQIFRERKKNRQEDELSNKYGYTRHMENPSKNRMAANTNPKLQQYYEELKYRAPDNYLISHTHWGQFLREAFKAIESSEESSPDNSLSIRERSARLGKEKQFIFRSGGHAFVMRLKVKQSLLGRKRYIATFYNPNKSVTHIRVAANNLDAVGKWNINKFLQQDAINFHYGREPDGIKITHALAVPEDLHIRLKEDKNLFDQAPVRKVQEFFSKDERHDPGRPFFILNAGLPVLDTLKDTIDQFSSPEDITKFFSIQHKEAKATGYQMAVKAGHVEQVKEFGDILLAQREKKKLSTDQLKQLLSLKRSGTDIAQAPAETQGQADAALTSAKKQSTEKLKIISADQQKESRRIHGQTILHAYAKNFFTEGDVKELEKKSGWLKKYCPIEYRAFDICCQIKTALTSPSEKVAEQETDAPFNAPSQPTPFFPREKILSNIPILKEVINQSKNLSEESKIELQKYLRNIQKNLKNHFEQNVPNKQELMIGIKKDLDQLGRIIRPHQQISLSPSSTSESHKVKRKL